MIGAHRLIEAGAVKVAAIIAGVVKYAVQHHADAPFLRLTAQLGEILLRTQQWVDGAVIRRIVAVVGGRLEDGVEIEGLYMEGGEIVQLGGDTLEIAAEEIAVPAACLGVSADHGRFVPVHMSPPLTQQTLHTGRRRAAEAIGEDLIGHAFTKPLGGIGLLIDRQLPRGAIVAAAAVFAQTHAAAVFARQGEGVPHQFSLRRGGVDAAKAIGAGEKGRFRPFVGKFMVAAQDAGGKFRLGLYKKAHLRAAGNGTKGRFIFLFA